VRCTCAIYSVLLIITSFWAVFWVDVSSPEMARNGFIAVAKALGSSAESTAESLHMLASIKRRWLLILDNADDLHYDYKVYIPSGSNGAVLMTSRVRECERYSTIKHETLEGLDLEHSTQLLLKAARIEKTLWQWDEEQARDIVHLLGSHTLALIQAGAYIAQGYCQLDQYLQKYQQQRNRLLEHYPSQEQSRYRNVYATFEASAEVLTDESGQDALTLLALLSMLHSSMLPLKIFEDAWTESRQVLEYSDKMGEAATLQRWHVSQLPELMGGHDDEWDDHRLMRAVSRLASLSLVTRDRFDNFDRLSMHPLTHTWAKDRLDRINQQQAWISAGCVLALSRGLSDTRQMYEEKLRPHIQSYLSSTMQEMISYGPQVGILAIVVKCGLMLNWMGENARLESLLKDIYKTLHIRPSDPSTAYLPIWNLAGRHQLNLGHYRRAVALLEHVVKTRKKTLANTHPSRLESQTNLAWAYQDNGQIKEAVNLLEHVDKVWETTLAKTHPDRLTSQNNLALAYQDNGQIKEAVTLLGHVVKVEEMTLAETHPDRLTSQHNLASAYQDNGQIKEAVTLLEHIVKVQETTLAETHPDRLASQHNLARAYQANGQIKEAVTLLEHVVKVRETTLAETHPDRLASQHNLARAYQDNGQIKEAVTLLEHVVKVRETTLAKTHPDRLASQHNLARAYQDNGQIKEAVALLEHVVKVRETTLAQTHPDRLASQHNLARAYQDNGQIKEAVALLEHVVKVRETTLAKTHPDRLASQHNLALAYQDNGQIKEAVALLEHVVKVRETTLTKTHPDRLASQHNLALAYQDNGQIKEAVTLLGHVVKVEEMTLAETHPDRLTSLRLLAILYKEDGQEQRATSLFEQVASIEEGL
jgi:tetratricopeptide (TPR) repeat protein